MKNKEEPSIRFGVDGLFIDGKRIDIENLHFSQTVTNKKTSKWDKIKKEWSDSFNVFLTYNIICFVLYGVSTDANPMRWADLLIAGLITYLLHAKKNK
ncbi:hypothetical protein ABEY43_06230 [Priestia megaterium]